MATTTRNGRTAGRPTRRKNGTATLKLPDIDTTQLPDSATYQAAMRKAVAETVTADDAAEIAKGIVKRAKEGDRHAIEQFFGHLLGGNQPIKAVQHNHYYGDDKQASPCGGGNPDPEFEAIYALLQTHGAMTLAELADLLDCSELKIKTVIQRNPADWLAYDGERLSIRRAG